MKMVNVNLENCIRVSPCRSINQAAGEAPQLIYSMIFGKAKAHDEERDVGTGRGEEEDRLVSSSPVSFSAPVRPAACTGSYTPPVDNTEIVMRVKCHVSSHTLWSGVLSEQK